MERKKYAWHLGDRAGYRLREGDRVLVGDEWAGQDNGKVGEVVELQTAPHGAVRLLMEGDRYVWVLAALVDKQEPAQAPVQEPAD